MKRLFSLILFFSVLTVAQVSAQDLIVSYVAGKVKLVAGGKTTDVALNSRLNMNSVVDVPYEGKLDLLDEKANKRYSIVKPGRSALSKHVAAAGNSTMDITSRYLSYVKSQIGSSDKSAKVMHAQVYSDYATVTRELQVAEEAEEKAEQEAELNSLNPRDRMLAKRELNHKRHDAFRESVMQRHLEFVRKAWALHDPEAAIQRLNIQEVRPQVVPVEANATDRLKVVDWVKKIITRAKDRDRIIEVEDVKPEVKPQPEPIVEFVEKKPLNPAKEKEVSRFPFSYCGTELSVRLDETQRLNVGKISPDRVADVLQRLMSGKYDNLVIDCLALRKEHNLNDWAYYQMLQTLFDEFCGAGTNEAVLMTAFVYSQSGYSVRMACDATDSQLYMLVQSDHTIFNTSFFQLGNPAKRFYVFSKTKPQSLMICQADFPQEQGLSLYLDKPVLLDDDLSDIHFIQGLRNKENVVKVVTNRNLMKFYETCPASYFKGNELTRWAMYADSPINPKLKDILYPQLTALIEGKSDQDKVNVLMDLLHGINYEFDETVWGHDRAFFVEETMHYPSCDCEDRSIALTRWVRDLIGLPCALIYYPGHLATAIHFNENVPGDRFVVDGVDYVVCDPTYLGSTVGMQMDRQHVDPDRAQVILLNK